MVHLKTKAWLVEASSEELLEYIQELHKGIQELHDGIEGLHTRATEIVLLSCMDCADRDVDGTYTCDICRCVLCDSCQRWEYPSSTMYCESCYRKR
jgi:hypothetical protein